MRRKDQVRKVGTVLLIIGAGAVGIMLGVFLFITNPGLIQVPIPTPPTATAAPFEQIATNTPTPQWIVTYEYRLPSNPLPSGRHTYELGVSCPAEFGTGTYQGDFSINEQAQILRNRVFLRPTGVWDSSVGGNQVGPIHPDQTLGVALSLRYPTLEQAEAARANCKVSVQLDYSRPVRLNPALPKEEQ